MERTTRIATAGLILGIAGLLGLAPLTSIPAVICGHVARERIRNSEGRRRGRRLAAVASALGYAGIALTLIVVPLVIAGPVITTRDAADDTAPAIDLCTRNLLIITFAKEEAMYDIGLSEGDTVTAEQLAPYIPGGLEQLQCPGGGAYIVNPIGREPECSAEGHGM